MKRKKDDSHKIDSAHTHSKDHMRYSNDYGQFHFEGVQEDDLVAGQLKSLGS